MKTILSRSLMALAITAFFGNTYAAELEEIIVTAQKRAESLQDVPISMSALDGQKLEEVGIHSFQELTAYVPNLSITENAVNTIIGMRGVGIGANQSFEQSVGIYVDGVHYGKSRQWGSIGFVSVGIVLTMLTGKFGDEIIFWALFLGFMVFVYLGFAKAPSILSTKPQAALG
ncbi:MAG: TonB-dependent receptor plug domain-containing protein, partial [Porticoccaceae bacterium]